MEFGRRMAVERDLEKSEAVGLANIVFDATGNFILYATLLGVKLVNLHTKRCVRIIGKNENLRLLHISLFQGQLYASINVSWDLRNCYFFFWFCFCLKDITTLLLLLDVGMRYFGGIS